VGAKLKPQHSSIEDSSSLVQAMNFANSSCYDDTARPLATEHTTSSISCLLVYDIQYLEGNNSENNNNSNNNSSNNNGSTDTSSGSTKSKKGHSGTRQENNMYADSFLSTFLYEAYDVAVIEDAAEQDEGLDDCIDLHPPPSSNAVKFGAENCLPPSPLVMKMNQNFPGVEPSEISVEPNLVQCFGLPEKLRKDLTITSIDPTKDGQHLLVTLGVPKDIALAEGGFQFEGIDTSANILENGNIINKGKYMHLQDSLPLFSTMLTSSDWQPDQFKESGIQWAYKFKEGKDFKTGVVMNGPHLPKPSKVEVLPGGCILTKYDDVGGNMSLVSSQTEGDDIAMQEQQQGGAVLLYSLSNGRVSEQPLVWRTLPSAPTETLLLPCADKETEEVHSKEAQGLAALVCQDGAVRVLDVASLSTVATAKPSQPSASFVSLTYCNSKYFQHLISIAFVTKILHIKNVDTVYSSIKLGI
jgi:hypothetical protein